MRCIWCWATRWTRPQRWGSRSPRGCRCQWRSALRWLRRCRAVGLRWPGRLQRQHRSGLPCCVGAPLPAQRWPARPDCPGVTLTDSAHCTRPACAGVQPGLWARGPFCLGNPLTSGWSAGSWFGQWRVWSTAARPSRGLLRGYANRLLRCAGIVPAPGWWLRACPGARPATCLVMVGRCFHRLVRWAAHPSSGAFICTCAFSPPSIRTWCWVTRSASPSHAGLAVG